MRNKKKQKNTIVAVLLLEIYSDWASELYGNFKVERRKSTRICILSKRTNSWKSDETTKPYYGVVFKPFHFAIANSSATEFLNQSFLLNFTYFILIRRKNRLRIIVSDKVARKKNTWHSRGDDIAKLEKIHLPLNQPKPLIERMRNSGRTIQEVETLLAGKNVLNLTYEDDIEQDPQKAYRSICEFVDMEATKASVNFSKTNPFPLKDIIENFAEVKAALHNTPYEWMPDS